MLKCKEQKIDHFSSIFPDFFFTFTNYGQDTSKNSEKLLPMNSILNIPIFEEAARVLNSIYIHNKRE